MPCVYQNHLLLYVLFGGHCKTTVENQECGWPRVTERPSSSDSKLDYPVAVV